MIAMTATSKRLLRSASFGAALVAVLTLLALLPYLGFFAYPLFAGIGVSGLIFSNGIESYHLLRFEVGAIFFNIIFYTALFYYLFSETRIRRRRTYSEYFPGAGSPSSFDEPGADSPSLRGTAAASAEDENLKTAEDK